MSKQSGQNIKNATGNPLTLFNGYESTVLPVSARKAYIKPVYKFVGDYDGFQLFHAPELIVKNEPKPIANTIFVVSAAVRMALAHREDIASPGELVLNADGKRLGYRGLLINQPKKNFEYELEWSGQETPDVLLAYDDEIIGEVFFDPIFWGHSSESAEDLLFWKVSDEAEKFLTRINQ